MCACPHENEKNRMLCVGRGGDGQTAQVFVCAVLHPISHVWCNLCRSQYKRDKGRKKRSKPILPPPSASRDVGHLTHPRMCNLCVGTVFVVLSMLLLTWNEVCKCVRVYVDCLYVIVM